MGFQVNAGRGAESFAGDEIETTVVFWALDHVLHHEPARQMHFRVGTQAIRGVVFVIARAVDTKCPVAVIEADHVVLLDRVRSASFNPTIAHAGAGAVIGFTWLGSSRLTKYVGSFTCL